MTAKFLPPTARRLQGPANLKRRLTPFAGRSGRMCQTGGFCRPKAQFLTRWARQDNARELYRKALDLQPNEPSVLSNLGMSYLLADDLRTAETYMRSAAQSPGADSRVRQNLALVVGLQGRFDEAEDIARQELSSEQAEANVAYLKSHACAAEFLEQAEGQGCRRAGRCRSIEAAPGCRRQYPQRNER